MKSTHQVSLNPVEWLALALVAIGAINWGLIGIAGFLGGNLNLVNRLLSGFPTIESLVYLVVGLAGLYMVYFGFQLFEARADRLAEPAEQTPTAK